MNEMSAVDVVFSSGISRCLRRNIITLNAHYFLLLSQNERTVDTMVTTTATPITMYISHSITSARKKLPASAIVARFIFDNSIHQRDGAFLHLSGQTVNLREDVAIEEL